MTPPCQCREPCDCLVPGYVMPQHRWEIWHGLRGGDPRLGPLIAEAWRRAAEEAKFRGVRPEEMGRLREVAAVRSSGGPGTELKALLLSLGKHSGDCSCDAWVARMNQWGPVGCREHRAEIVAHLEGETTKAGWLAKTKAAALAVTSGLALTIDPRDPLGSLVDEAIRRAEARGPG